MMKIKKCRSTVRSKYIGSWKSTFNSEAVKYKLPKGKEKHNNLQTFIELVENDMFKPNNYKRIENNINNR